MHFLDLPDVLLIEIFEYLSYEDVSKKRLICRRLDQICQHVLNCGFNKIVRKHTLSFKRIKALLPRRESERRNHSLARHADILTSIETRISMLSMTYSKYIDLHLCCFIPGRVLDEILRILMLISKTSKPLRPHEVLQELRDISSMAIEHFDEKIANTLKKAIVVVGSGGGSGIGIGGGSHTLGSSGSGGMIDPTTRLTGGGLSNIVVQHHQPCTSSLKRISASGHSQNCNCWQRGNNIFKNLNPAPSVVNAESSNNAKQAEQLNCPQARSTALQFKKLEMEHKKLIVKMQRMQQIQTHQGRRLQQALNAISEQNTQIVDLKKRLEDLDAKNREISANIKQQIITGETTNDDTTPTNTPSPPSPIPSSATATATTPTTGTTKAKNSDPNSNMGKRRHENIPTVTSDTSIVLSKKRRC